MHDLIEGSYSCRLEEIIRAEKEESLTFSLCLSSCHSWFITHQPSPHLNWSAAKKKDDYAKIRRQQWCYRELPYMNYNRKDSIFRTAHTKQSVTISCIWSRLDSYSNSDQFFSRWVCYPCEPDSFSLWPSHPKTITQRSLQRDKATWTNVSTIMDPNLRRWT